MTITSSVGDTYASRTWPHVDNNRVLAQQFAAASQAFHAQRRHAAPVHLRQHLGLEAAESRVQAIERHLHSVERESVEKHLQMNGRIFMSREPEKNRTLPCCLASSRASA